MSALIVRPATRADHDAWLPLWDGYNAFYGRSGDTALAPEITAATWNRFFDPYEPMFALVAEDTLYLKADEDTAIAFKAEGCGPFLYDGKDRPVAMRYWRLPERLYDEPDEFRQWALNAFAVAERAQAERPKRKSRPSKPRRTSG